MKKQYFGTDGIRGVLGGPHINPEFVLKLGWAVGKVLANGTRRKVLIGKDTRVSGYMLESALEAGLSAAGVDIRLLGPMPTPAIAYLTQTFRASAGIVISASHNGFEDNGIKFFNAQGLKLEDRIEHQIIEYLEKPIETVPSKQLGKAARIEDAPGRYIEFCKSTVAPSTRLCGLKIVVDCANGATYHIAPAVLRELGAEVITIANKPDGFNINDACGSTAPASLQQAVIEHSADVGIAFDGDGDRVIMVDEQGVLLDGDAILYVIAMDLCSQQKYLGGVVGTILSNLGLEHSLREKGVAFHRTNVGDRFVSQALLEKGWSLGGETSGHVICRDKITTGDGIIAALQVLSAMARQEKPLSALHLSLRKCPQVQKNIPVTDALSILNNNSIQALKKEVEHALLGQGRVIIRPSGTEPVIRIMLEGEDVSALEYYVQQFEREIEHVCA